MFVKVSFMAAASVAAAVVSRINNIPSPRKRNLQIRSTGNPENVCKSRIFENDDESSSQKEEIEEDEEENLQNLVKDMERKRIAIEAKLLEMYGIKGHSSCIAQLQKHLKVKTEEVGGLSIAVNSLRAERKKLLEGSRESVLVEKQLEIAKKRVKELEEKMSEDRNWVRKTWRTLAEEVYGFEKSGICGRDHENVEKMIRNVELKAMQMKRRNKELEMERRGLRIMLMAAEDKVTRQVSVSDQIDKKEKLEEEMNHLRSANESLSKQIEKLQKNRLAIVEELMYQCSLNTCLRFETENFLKYSCQKSHGNKSTTPTPIPHQNSYSKSSSTSSIDSSTTDGSSSSQDIIIKKYGLIYNTRSRGRRKESSRWERSGGLIRWLSLSDVPLDGSIVCVG